MKPTRSKPTREERRRAEVERVLTEHGIDYSPPDTLNPSSWRIRTAAGMRHWDLRQVEAYCQGLADHEALPTCRGSAPEGLSGTNDALTSASAPQGTTGGDPGASAEGSGAPDAPLSIEDDIAMNGTLQEVLAGDLREGDVLIGNMAPPTLVTDVGRKGNAMVVSLATGGKTRIGAGIEVIIRRRALVEREGGLLVDRSRS
jgi:hypothetical protein